jgi:hypothetical protein
MPSQDRSVRTRIRLRRLVEDIRSGMPDDLLMSTYQLSRKGLQRLLKRLVNERLIDHDMLYERSEVYKDLADRLSSRKSPRCYVPIALRVYRNETGERGFIRDISDNGIRVAGIKAETGDKVIFDIPKSEEDGIDPLQFEALCRWVRLEGSHRKYPVGGFEITTMSEEARIRFREIWDLVLTQANGEERRLYSPINVPELLKPTSQPRAEAESRSFSGTVDDVSILDFVQFMILIRKKTVLHVHSLFGEKGQLYIDDGRIVHAIKGKKEGKEAFYECMNFQSGIFSTKRWHEPSKRSINMPGDFLLMEAARKSDELQALSVEEMSCSDDECDE